MYMTGPSVSDTPNYGASPGMSSGVQFPSAFQPPINVQNALNSQAFLPNTTMPTATASGLSAAPQNESNDQEEGADDPKLQEATKLIQCAHDYSQHNNKLLIVSPSYHLDNYKRNNAYCLPQSLRPTLVQRFVSAILSCLQGNSRLPLTGLSHMVCI